MQLLAVALQQVADFGFLVVDFLPDFGERQDAFLPPGCCGVLADFQQANDVAVVQPVLRLRTRVDVQLSLNGIQALKYKLELVVRHSVGSIEFVQAKVGGRKNGRQLHKVVQPHANTLTDNELRELFFPVFFCLLH